MSALRSSHPAAKEQAESADAHQTGRGRFGHDNEQSRASVGNRIGGTVQECGVFAILVEREEVETDHSLAKSAEYRRALAKAGLSLPV